MHILYWFVLTGLFRVNVTIKKLKITEAKRNNNKIITIIT